MKQKLLLLLLGVLSALPALARDFKYTYEGQTITYTVIDEDAKTCKTKDGYWNSKNSYGAGNRITGSLCLPANPKDGDVEYTLTTISYYAFARCGDLTSIAIPNSVTSIEERAFQECIILKSVVIPNSVTSIGWSAFTECRGLIKSAYPNTLENPFSKGISVAYNPEGAIIEDGWVWGPEKTEIRFVPYNLDGEYLIPESVTSIGSAAFKGCSGLTSLEIPNSVTSIGSSAFSGCSGLTSVVIPNSVTSIGSAAFGDCSGLTSLEIPNSVTSIGGNAFINCSGLTSVEIPNSVTEIGVYAFYGCSGLTSVVIPNSVTSIGSLAFYGCSGLIKSAYPNTLENPFKNGVAVAYNPEGAIIEDGVVFGKDKSALYFAPLSLKGEYLIPNSVTSIGNQAFLKCYGLTSVVIPNSVTSIGSYAFSNCNGLKKSAYPNNLENPFGNGIIVAYNPEGAIIEDGVVFGKDKSTLYFAPLSIEGEYSIPKAVTSIGKDAFRMCSGLTSVVIPNAVTSIGEYAFYGCSGLIKSAYPNTLNNPFDNGIAITYKPGGAIIENGWIWGPEKSAIYFAPLSLEGEYQIPESVTLIGSSAFRKCSGLTSVVIGNSVKTIGEYAFSGCSGLTSVVIPNSVTSIGSAAFEGCSGLPSVVIPESVTYIGDAAFWNSGLISLTFNAENCRSCGTNYIVFPNTIENLAIGDKVKTIPTYAFYNLEKLTSVVIPNSVTSIGEKAFYGCSGLTSVKSLPASPAVMNDNSFEDLYESVKLSVPDEAVNDYLATNWGLFKNIQNNSGKELGYFTDGVLEYRLNPTDMTAMVIGAKSYSNIQIPERFTDDTDTANPVRYYIKGIGYKAFDGKGVESVEFNSRSQMEYIGDYAFANTYISSITLPETMEKIGNYSFYKASYLSEVKLNEGLALIGDYAFAESGLSSISVPESVNTIGSYAFFIIRKLNEVELKEGLVSIGSHAFAGTNISSISVPGSVSTIGDYAFYNASNLSEVRLNEGLASIGDYAFAETKISSISVPGSVAAIGKYAFKILNLREVVLEEGVASIGNYAFAESGTSSISIPGSVSAIGDYAFYNTYSLSDVVLTEGLESIGRYTFSAENERSVTGKPLYLPSTVKSVGMDAFKNFVCSQVDISDLNAWLNIDFRSYLANPLCGTGNGLYVNGEKLTSLKVPEDIKEIKPYAFYNCKSLEEVTFPEGLEKIGRNSFHSCSNVTEVTIPASVVEIGDQVFGQSKVTFADGLLPISLGESAFSNVRDLYCGRPLESLTLNIDNVTSLGIGNLITEIPDGRFKNLTSLKSLSLGNSIESIGNGAFSGCRKLTDLKFAGELQTIGDDAFSGCTSLEEVILPPSVETIGASAFAGDSNLASIIMGHKVKTIGEKAFDGCKANTVSITAQTPPTAPNNTFSNYTGKLYLQGEKAKDAYYDAFTCWDRFDSYVMIDAEEIKILGMDKISGKRGDTFQLTASVWPENATLPQIFWRSTNPEIATVDANGLVTLQVDLESLKTRAQGEGDIEGVCTIIAETLYNDGPIAQVGVTAEDTPIIAESITLSQESWSAHTGETVKLTATVLPEDTTDKTVTWTSSNDAVATVDTEGNVTAVAVGEADITATCGSVSASCKVTVTPILIESLTIDPTVWSGEEGSEFTIKATVLPENAEDKTLTFESNDTAIATVDAEGNVKVLKEGSCVITVATTDGSNLTAECVITSLSGVDAIFADPDAMIDVYDMNGVMLKKGCSREELKQLTPAVYIFRSGDTVVKAVVR